MSLFPHFPWSSLSLISSFLRNSTENPADVAFLPKGIFKEMGDYFCLPECLQGPLWLPARQGLLVSPEDSAQGLVEPVLLILLSVLTLPQASCM